MIRALLTAATLAVVGVNLTAHADEKVAIRTTDGRFLSVGLDGTLRLGGRVPGAEETFEASCPAEGQIALRRPGGPYLTAAGPTGRNLRGDGPWDKPGDRECFRVISAGGNRARLQARGCPDAAALDSPVQPGSAALKPEDCFDIFIAADVPANLRDQVSGAVAALANSELRDEEYHRERSRQREEYIDVPSPRRGDLWRTTPRRVFSMTEEQEITARLDGPLELHIDRLQCLRGYTDRAAAVLLFAVRGRAPVNGRVRYRVPDVLSASTGFSAIVDMNCMGEVRANRSGEEIVLAGELADLHLRIRSLDLSNTILATARRPIEDIINGELRENQVRLRQKANTAIARELGKKKLDHPLLQFWLL